MSPDLGSDRVGVPRWWLLCVVADQHIDILKSWWWGTTLWILPACTSENEQGRVTWLESSDLSVSTAKRRMETGLVMIRNGKKPKRKVLDMCLTYLDMPWLQSCKLGPCLWLKSSPLILSGVLLFSIEILRLFRPEPFEKQMTRTVQYSLGWAAVDSGAMMKPDPFHAQIVGVCGDRLCCMFKTLNDVLIDYTK